ncbi:hypothetical protein [Actinomadura gamaensis]|uniref:Polyketide cyclase / dehydrase and lipid transport n=1 Tax=Actinomadura gamaensis TaxID=1763541 RepID=A0ABV9UF80_9ACTN
MYVFGDEKVISGDTATVWAVWCDVERFPDWDPREAENRLDGPFGVGTSGYSKQHGNPGGPYTITAVEPERVWTARSPLPGGELTVHHGMEAAGAGKVRVWKRYEVRGPLGPLFRCYYGPKVRRALAGTFAALEREAARR